MRKFLSFLTIALVALQLSAAPVDVATAKTKAQQYLTQKVFAGKFMVPGATDAKLVKTEMGDKAKAPVYYIFNTETTFIIVSGDDRAEEVLAYGDRPLNLDRIPTNMQVWLDGYKRQIDWLLTNPDAKVEKPTTVKAAGLKATTYGPLLTALWDQTEPYWNQCKFTYSGTTYQCYTGCPATSASMVMYYWKYPKGQVPAMPSYTNSLELSSYNTVSFAYPALPATTFDWDNMIDDYTSPAATGYTTAQGNAVATLMRYVGQGEQMMYGTASAGGSGIYTSNAQIVADMYINFGYDETTTRLVRKSNYTEAQWAQLLQTEMIEGRPVVFMAVDNSAGGHAFNVDGYDSSTNKYHINFGWSGDGNNWCAMNAFADGEGYNFNSDQQMIIGIQPGSGFIKATPENLDFTGYAGETYTKTFRVEARGMENNITIAQSGSNVFTISNTTITPAQAENGVDVTVTYKPTAAGNTTASLTLSCADEGVDDVTVQLTGVAKPRVPTLVADPTSLSFVAKLGKTVTKTINLTGVFLTGNVTATLTDPSGVFSVSPATIAPTSFNGETPLQVAVSFMSNEEANYTGSLTFASNGAESVTVQLSAKANDGGTATDPYLDIAKYETIDEAGASVSGMQTIYKYTEYADQECGWLTLSNYGVKQADANQDWFESGSLTQYGNSWSSSDIFLGQTPYFGSSSAYSVYGSNSQSFYVTNCIQVKAYVKGSSYSSSSAASLSIYECTVNANGSVTASSSAIDTKTGANGVITSSTLDATKVYKVQLTGGGSYPDLLEIGFCTPLETYEVPVASAATDVTSNSFTANWSACTGATSYTLRVQPVPPYTMVVNEDFANFTTASSQDISSKLDENMSTTGWTGSKLYAAVGGIRLGTGSAVGSLTTPSLDLTSSAGKVSAKIKAKTFTNNSGTSDSNCELKLSCGTSENTIVVPTNEETEYIVVLDCNIGTSQKLTFSTTSKGKRVIITNIEIYAGDLTKSNVLKAYETMTFTGITGNSYEVTGLNPETSYVYDVKAIYGSDETKWSNAISVTTLAGEEGITLAELLSTGVDGEQYTISNDLAVADVAKYVNNAFLIDGEGNWIMLTADDEIFNSVLDMNVIKGGTLKATLSGIELNPVLTATAAPEAGSEVIPFEVVAYNLADTFDPKVNQVIDVTGFWRASDGALRAYSSGGQSMTLNTSWGASNNTLVDGKRYTVRCAMNIKEAWKVSAGLMPKDYDYDFQNYLGYALRLPDTPTAITTIGADGNEIVNVYNVQGMLLKQNIKAADALKELPRGIYIIGNRKVIVR